MKSRINFITLSLSALLLITLTMFSCKKDSDPMEPVPTTVAEDRENIQTTMDNMLVCVEDMTQARSIDIFLRDMLDVSDGEALNEEWAENLSDGFEQVFDFENINDSQRFNIVYHAGVYSYNLSTASWSKTDATDNSVTLQFPSSPEATSNNMVVFVDRYEDQQITVDGEVAYAPNSVHALVTVDGQRTFELNIANVTYAENADYEIPVEIDARIFMDPMNISVKVDRMSTTEYKGNLSFSDGSSCDMSIEAELELADDDFENLTEESLVKLHAKLDVGDLTVQSFAGLAELLKIEDPSESEINSLLDLDVLFNNVKIADLEYDETEENFIIFYKDESTESAANFVDSFLEDMEIIVKEFTGEW